MFISDSELLNSGTEKKFQCGKCNNYYKYRKNLQRHLKWECGKSAQFECKICSYTSKRKDLMTKHWSKVHSIDLFQI